MCQEAEWSLGLSVSGTQKRLSLIDGGPRDKAVSREQNTFSDVHTCELWAGRH